MNDTLEDIANSTKFPKLRTYKLFKKNFRLENYLIEIENTKHALALARFRISSHNLRIETGRYDQRKIKAVFFSNYESSIIVVSIIELTVNCL